MIGETEQINSECSVNLTLQHMYTFTCISCLYNPTCTSTCTCCKLPEL